MLTVLKSDHRSVWLSGLCGGEKLKKLRGQDMEWSIYVDIEIWKNPYDRNNEKVSHEQSANTWKEVD